LYFQDGRHPAPLFLTTALAPPATTPATKPVAAPQTAEAPATQIDAPKAKVETAHAPVKAENARSESAAPAKIAAKTPVKTAEPAKHDPIAQLLNGPAKPKAPAESDVLMAQQALLKLGYVVRADGKFSAATRQAIEKFEHDHGLPVKGALTTKVAAQLATRAGLESE
jgi:peptidoglycan hydrolase-like protein with peptidoglycan-binding domain